jgi:hypothetical protein
VTGGTVGDLNKAKRDAGMREERGNDEPKGEMVDEERDRYRSLGRSDQNRGRNRYMGGGTPDDIASDKEEQDKAAARTLEQLRRRRAAEAARKEGR